MITAKDESLHPASDDPFWSESAYFPILVPDRNVSGWVYFFHRPNMNLTVGGVALWDPSGAETYDCLVYDWGDLLPTPAGADMFDFSLSNGLTVKCVEPLQSFTLQYENGDRRFDLRWDATEPPFEAAWGKESTTDDWAKGHYEQCGRMHGTVTIGDDVIEVDHWSNRDRSWGPRHYVNNPGGDFPWAIASDDAGFHALATDTTPRTTYRDGDPSKVIFGWYRHEGRTCVIASGSRETVERGPDGRPLRVVIDATDAEGRALRAEGRCLNWLKWHGYATMFQWWCLVEWRFDGHTAYGELMEYLPLEEGRRALRSTNQGVAAC